MTDEAQAQLYFDQDLGLEVLLEAMDLAALQRVLAELIGGDWRMTEPGGRVILGASQPLPGATRKAFHLELEPLGYLESTHASHLDAASALVEILMRAAARYLMASSVQMETVSQDYRVLSEKNVQLRESEERYRRLAASLEQRVAEQVRAIENAQRQLYQAEKLASVGRLAAGVAHEINNPIGFVKSNLNTALSYVESLERLMTRLRAPGDAADPHGAGYRQIDAVLADFPALLRESLEGVGRVARIVSALKDFSSVDRTQEGVADVNHLLGNACEVLAGRFADRIRLITGFAELPALRCHAGQLSQAFLNILLNAVQAIAERGEVEVVTVLEDGDIIVRIRDSGAGIAPEALARVFEPFFTTREPGHGAGLGLTVARDVIQAHGGRVEVASELGVGTTVTMILPASRQT